MAFLLKSPTVETNAPPDPSALHVAASNGHASIVTLLLESGAGINAHDRSGFTPLLDAVAGGHEDIVQMLVERGAHMRLKDEQYVRVIAFESTNPGIYGVLMRGLMRRGEGGAGGL